MPPRAISDNDRGILELYQGNLFKRIIPVAAVHFLPVPSGSNYFIIFFSPKRDKTKKVQPPLSHPTFFCNNSSLAQPWFMAGRRISLRVGIRILVLRPKVDEDFQFFVQNWT